MGDFSLLVCGGSVKDVYLAESWREAGVRRMSLHILNTSGEGELGGGFFFFLEYFPGWVVGVLVNL